MQQTQYGSSASHEALARLMRHPFSPPHPPTRGPNPKPSPLHQPTCPTHKLCNALAACPNTATAKGGRAPENSASHKSGRALHIDTRMALEDIFQVLAVQVQKASLGSAQHPAPHHYVMGVVLAFHVQQALFGSVQHPAPHQYPHCIDSQPAMTNAITVQATLQASPSPVAAGR
jgi:hypothetical protein